MAKRKFTYTVEAVFGKERLTTKEDNFADVEKIVEVVYRLGGYVIEITVEEVMK